MACAFDDYFQVSTSSNRQDAIMQKISQTKLNLQATQQHYLQAQQQLQTLEQRIGRIARSLYQLNQQDKNNQFKLAQLTKQQHDIVRDLQTGHHLLQQQIAAMYVASHVSPWQMILNDTKINNLSRYLTYHKYSLQARMRSLKILQQTAQKLQKNQLKIEQLQQALKTNINTIQQQAEKLTQQKQARKNLVKQFSQKVNQQQNQLTQLIANKQALQHVLTKVQTKQQHQGITIVTDEKATQAALATPDKFADFASMHHQLSWPVAGKVSKTFNSPMNGGRMQFNGILIEAPTGTPVRAVYPGKVLFANWLRGLGLLIIIDHGHGYLTLYGRNQSLYATEGDTVKTGDMIATVGNSGGYQDSALYFAIRHRHQFLNPQAWLK